MGGTSLKGKDSAGELLDDAARLDAERPSYYGGAWVQLIRAMLEAGSLRRC